MEYCRRLNEFDMLVQMCGQTILGRAHEDITVLVVLPYAELL